MEIYKFMSKLTNELNKNLFYNIEIDKNYNNYDKTYLIHIIADKDNKRYDYGFSVHENWLDDNSINELINLQSEVKGVNVKVKEKSGMRKDRFSSLQYNIYVTMLLEQKLGKIKEPRSLTSLPSCVSAINF